MKEALVNLLERYSYYEKKEDDIYIYHTAELSEDEIKKMEDLFNIKLININSL